MKYPVLSTAFCGCSLQLGTIVIGWIQIALQAVLVVLFVPAMVLAAAAFSANTKQIRGKQSEVYDDAPWKLNGYKQTSDDFVEHWDTGNKQTSTLVGLGTVLIIFIAVVLIIQLIATILLLVGAHKRRPGFLVLWLVLAVFGLFGSLHSMTLLGIIITIINLYFIWVVYSFYRELKTNPNPTSESAPGDVKLRGDDVPHVPTQYTPDAPPAYSYTQKEF